MNARRIAIVTSLFTSLFLLAAALPVPAQALGKAERACAASKLKATAKKASAKIKCEAKAIVKELPATDVECLGKAESKFVDAFAKAEEKGGCISQGDAASVEASVDDFVSGEVSRQKTGESGLPNCTPLGGTCGSCGSSSNCLLSASGESACVVLPTVPPASCTSDADCGPGTYCAGYPGTYYCMAPCL